MTTHGSRNRRGAAHSAARVRAPRETSARIVLILATSVATATFGHAALAQTPEPTASELVRHKIESYRLWAERAPEAQGDLDEETPTLTVAAASRPGERNGRHHCPRRGVRRTRGNARGDRAGGVVRGEVVEGALGRSGAPHPHEEQGPVVLLRTVGAGEGEEPVEELGKGRRGVLP